MRLSTRLKVYRFLLPHLPDTKRWQIFEKKRDDTFNSWKYRFWKTTCPTELKGKTEGIIFSINKWNKTLFLDDKKTTDGLEWFLERINRAEEMIMDLIIQLENVETDSILDLGLSKFEHREKFR